MSVSVSDPERRLALAYVPAARRPALAALFALDERLARIVLSAREPAIGQLRLAWWRDALARLDAAPPPAEPLLRTLAADLLPAGVTGAGLADLTEGWDALLPLDAVDEDALGHHAEARGERLFALAGRILGGTPPTGAGAAWARADASRLLPGTGRGTVGGGGRGWPRVLRWVGSALRHASPTAASQAASRDDLPPADHSAPLRPPPRTGEERWPAPLRPLGMLAILARRDPAERQGSPARILRMLRHRLTGR